MQNSMSATLRDIPTTSLTAFPDCLWRIHYLLLWKHPNASVCLFPRFGFHFISQLYSQRDPRWRGNFQFLVSDSHLFIASPSFTLFRRGLVWRSEVLVSIVEVGWNDPSIQIDFWCEAVTSYWQWKKQVWESCALRSIGFHVFHASMLDWRVCDVESFAADYV